MERMGVMRKPWNTINKNLESDICQTQDVSQCQEWIGMLDCVQNLGKYSKPRIYE